MNFKQKNIAKLLGVTQAMVSMILSGERLVSWPIAQKLTELFPGKDIVGWKNSTPEELKRAFRNLEIEEVA